MSRRYFIEHVLYSKFDILYTEKRLKDYAKEVYRHAKKNADYEFLNSFTYRDLDDVDNALLMLNDRYGTDENTTPFKEIVRYKNAGVLWIEGETVDE